MVRVIFVAAPAVRRSQSKCVLAASESLAPVSRRKRLLGARAMPQQRPGGWRCWISNAVGRVTPCVARLKTKLPERAKPFTAALLRFSLGIDACSDRWPLQDTFAASPAFPELLGERYTAFTAAAPASLFTPCCPRNPLDLSQSPSGSVSAVLVPKNTFSKAPVRIKNERVRSQARIDVDDLESIRELIAGCRVLQRDILAALQRCANG